jgi:type VI secretion system ImpM family protein
VFGLIKEKQAWRFAAFGKHPSAGDYISLGAPTPLLKGFSSWMEKGYGQIPPELRSQQGLDWQFWARGPNAKLICGLLTSSRDKHGRPYPLMIAGEGRVPESVKDWDLIPLACAVTWRHLARLHDEHLDTIKALKRRVARIKGPESPWAGFREQRDAVKNMEISPTLPGTHSDFMNKMNNVDGLARKKRFFLGLDVGDPNDCLVPVTKFLILLKNRSKIGPGTAFLGGNGRRKRLYLLNDSLDMDDFMVLWNGQDGDGEA